MSATKRAPVWLRIANYLVILLLILLSIFIATVNYEAGIAIAVGLIIFVIAWLAAWLLIRYLRDPSTPKVSAFIWALRITAVLYVGQFLLMCLLFFIIPFSPARMIRPLEQLPVEVYRAYIEPVDLEAGKFKVTEEIVIDTKDPQTVALNITPTIAFSLEERYVESVDQGLLIRQVSFAPLKARSGGYASVPLEDGHTIKGYICAIKCPDTSIELLNFPKAAFNGALESVEMAGELGDDRLPAGTLPWTMRTLRYDVSFTYMPPPFYYARPYLEPFANINSFYAWIGAVLVPMVYIFVKKKLSKRFENKEEKKPEEEPPNED